jgi:hypothetical protein
MKKIILLSVFAITANLVSAQNYQSSKKAKQKLVNESTNDAPKIFANLSSGINNPNAFIGIGIDVCFAKNMLAALGVGSGTAGNKFNFKGMYFLKDNYLGSALGLSLNFTSGVTSSVSNPSKTTSTPIASYDYKIGSGISANLMYGRYWKVARTGKFFINTGLAFQLSKAKIELNYAGTTIPLSTINYDLEYKSYNLFTPGGLVFAAGFLIQLNK